MATKTPKVLVHGDGTPFAVWNPDGKPVAYAMYFTDEDVPPAPESLGIKQTGGFDRDMAGMHWMNVTTLKAEYREEHELLAPYENDE